MNWIPKIEEKKLVVINATGLATYDEEKCRFCGRYGCTDRGFTLTVGESPVPVAEAVWVAQVQNKLASIIEANKEDVNVHFNQLAESRCVRKLKQSNVHAVLHKLKSCGPDCRRNMNCASDNVDGGVWKERGDNYQCPFRDNNEVCQRNQALDLGPLLCQPDKEGLVECGFHEEAYRRCFRRKEGASCYDLNDKLGVANKKHDKLLMLVHRFNAATCRHCDESICKNESCLHFEGMCTLKGLMAPCEKYEPVEPSKAYTEGVCTYVSSADGKDDRLIFPSSDYAKSLSSKQRDTLCIACRISHSIAQVTGLKCLGVRRATTNPFLNKENPIADQTIQINYLYLTHPDDVAKYNPEVIAQAVYDAITNDCAGIGCEEYATCNFNPM